MTEIYVNLAETTYRTIFDVKLSSKQQLWTSFESTIAKGLGPGVLQDCYCFSRLSVYSGMLHPWASGFIPSYLTQVVMRSC